MKVQKPGDPMAIRLFGSPGVVAGLQACTQFRKHRTEYSRRRLPIVAGFHGPKRRIDFDGFPRKETQQLPKRLLTLGNRPMPFLSMPSPAGHRFDLRHMIGGIGDLHDQPSLLPRPHPNEIRRHPFPSIGPSVPVRARLLVIPAALQGQHNSAN